MITSFACRDTEALFSGRGVARFVRIERAAIRKLQQIHAAATLTFVRAPPGNRLERLERLSGVPAGWYSLRVSVRWRICFHFADGDASEVRIIDYH